MSTNPRIGDSISRTDGVKKVTGTAPYAAEHFPSGLLYGWIVSSGIAKGSIKNIDDSRARKIAGVVEIITHQNRPHMAFLDGSYGDDVASIKAFGLDVVTRLCERLRDGGAPALHFYTMNQSAATLALLERLGKRA